MGEEEGNIKGKHGSVYQTPKNPEEQPHHPSLIGTYLWQRVMLSSIVFLKHKMLGSVAIEKIRWVGRVDNLGHKRPQSLHREVWTSSQIIFVFINPEIDFYLWP